MMTARHVFTSAHTTPGMCECGHYACDPIHYGAKNAHNHVRVEGCEHDGLIALDTIGVDFTGDVPRFVVVDKNKTEMIPRYYSYANAQEEADRLNREGLAEFAPYAVGEIR
jgi:hypothetical protein